MGCAICKSPPFIFIHIPKTGGTSFLSRRSPVFRQIKPHCKDLIVMGGHKYLRDMTLGCCRVKLKSYFKFTIVRNPYDRFISLWKVKAPKNTLDEFIEMFQSGQLSWYPLKPQCKWVGTRGGKQILTDHEIKYEDYEDGINETLKRLGLPSVRLPHLRRSNREKDFRPYYTNDEQIKFVQKLYELDFKHFNYSKEIG